MNYVFKLNWGWKHLRKLSSGKNPDKTKTWKKLEENLLLGLHDFQTFKESHKCRFSWFREIFWYTGKVQWGGKYRVGVMTSIETNHWYHSSILLPWWQGWNEPSWWFVLMWKNFLIYLMGLTSKEVAVASPCKYLLFGEFLSKESSSCHDFHCFFIVVRSFLCSDSFCLSAQMPFTIGCWLGQECSYSVPTPLIQPWNWRKATQGKSPQGPGCVYTLF